MSTVALTFDDGPDPEWTPLLLDLLAAGDAKATFFPIASRAAAAPRLIRRMLDEGHAVGLHCAEHVRHSTRTREWLRRDTATGLAVLRRNGVEADLWRTPWGDVADWTLGIAREYRLRLVGWTVDTHDWRGDSATAMFTATVDQLEPGAVVLAHDAIGPGALRSDPSPTLDYVALLLDHAAEADLKLEALQ